MIAACACLLLLCHTFLLGVEAECFQVEGAKSADQCVLLRTRAECQIAMPRCRFYDGACHRSCSTINDDRVCQSNSYCVLRLNCYDICETLAPLECLHFRHCLPTIDGLGCRARCDILCDPAACEVSTCTEKCELATTREACSGIVRNGLPCIWLPMQSACSSQCFLSATKEDCYKNRWCSWEQEKCGFSCRALYQSPSCPAQGCTAVGPLCVRNCAAYYRYQDSECAKDPECEYADNRCQINCAQFAGNETLCIASGKCFFSPINGSCHLNCALRRAVTAECGAKDFCLVKQLEFEDLCELNCSVFSGFRSYCETIDFCVWAEDGFCYNKCKELTLNVCTASKFCAKNTYCTDKCSLYQNNATRCDLHSDCYWSSGSCQTSCERQYSSYSCPAMSCWSYSSDDEMEYYCWDWCSNFDGHRDKCPPKQCFYDSSVSKCNTKCFYKGSGQCFVDSNCQTYRSECVPRCELFSGDEELCIGAGCLYFREKRLCDLGCWRKYYYNSTACAEDANCIIGESFEDPCSDACFMMNGDVDACSKSFECWSIGSNCVARCTKWNSPEECLAHDGCSVSKHGRCTLNCSLLASEEECGRHAGLCVYHPQTGRCLISCENMYGNRNSMAPSTGCADDPLCYDFTVSQLIYCRQRCETFNGRADCCLASVDPSCLYDSQTNMCLKKCVENDNVGNCSADEYCKWIFLPVLSPCDVNCSSIIRRDICLQYSRCEYFFGMQRCDDKCEFSSAWSSSCTSRSPMCEWRYDVPQKQCWMSIACPDLSDAYCVNDARCVLADGQCHDRCLYTNCEGSYCQSKEAEGGAAICAEKCSSLLTVDDCNGVGWFCSWDPLQNRCVICDVIEMSNTTFDSFRIRRKCFSCLAAEHKSSCDKLRSECFYDPKLDKCVDRCDVLKASACETSGGSCALSAVEALCHVECVLSMPKAECESVGCVAISTASASLAPTESKSLVQSRSSVITETACETITASVVMRKTVTLLLSKTIRQPLTSTLTVEPTATFSLTSAGSSTMAVTKTGTQRITLTASLTATIVETETLTSTDTRTDLANTLSKQLTLTATSSCPFPAVLWKNISSTAVYDVIRFGLNASFWFGAALAQEERNTEILRFVTVSWGVVSRAMVVGAAKLTVRVAPPGQVSLLSSPNVILQFLPQVFECRPQKPVEFSIVLQSISLPTSKKARDVAQTSAIIGGALGSGFSPSMAVSQARGSMMLDLSVCEFSHSEQLPTALNPTRLGFGSAQGMYYRGAVVGNCGLMLAATALVYCIPIVFYFTSGATITFAETLQNMHLPGFLVVPFVLFIEPTTTVATSLIMHGDEGMLDGFIAFVGMILCSAPLLYLAFYMTFAFAAEATIVERRRSPNLNISGKCLWLFTRLYLGNVKWRDTGKSVGFKKRFAPVFVMYRDGCQWAMIVELLFALVCGVIQGARPETRTGCEFQIYLSLAVAVLGALFSTVVRPYASVFFTFYFFACSILNAASCIALMLGAEAISDYLSMVQIFGNLGTVLFEILLLLASAPALRLRDQMKKRLHVLCARVHRRVEALRRRRKRETGEEDDGSSEEEDGYAIDDNPAEAVTDIQNEIQEVLRHAKSMGIESEEMQGNGERVNNLVAEVEMTEGPEALTVPLLSVPAANTERQHRSQSASQPGLPFNKGTAALTGNNYSMRNISPSQGGTVLLPGERAQSSISPPRMSFEELVESLPAAHQKELTPYGKMRAQRLILEEEMAERRKRRQREELRQQQQLQRMWFAQLASNYQ